jgi:hypothetical protein
VLFVRDRQQAEIHILMTEQKTGGGGKEHSIELIGQGIFAGMIDTIRTITKVDATEDDIRRAMARTIKLALSRFVLRTPLAEYMTVDYNPPAILAPTADKWNNWVGELSVDLQASGEKTYRFFSTTYSVSARRVIEDQKYKISLWGQHYESRYDYGDLSTLSISRSFGLSSHYIFAIGNQWSLGSFGYLKNDTYSNMKFSGELQSALEYSLFPYSQATQRYVRVSYYLCPRYLKYDQLTLYDKTEEWLVSHRLELAVDLIYPWGSINNALSGSHHFGGLRRNRIVYNMELFLNVVKGLTLNLSFQYSRIRDQINIAKGEASESEVLLQRRQLETNFSYFLIAGIRYSFGSINNSIVNRRFGN